jgi:hypothetical protein
MLIKTKGLPVLVVESLFIFIVLRLPFQTGCNIITYPATFGKEKKGDLQIALLLRLGYREPARFFFFLKRGLTRPLEVCYAFKWPVAAPWRRGRGGVKEPGFHLNRPFYFPRGGEHPG